MNLTVRQYTNFDKDNWDFFVNTSFNGTIFHLRSFLSYHIERSFNDHSLIFENNGNIIAIFPAAKIIQNNLNILYSHPGASFGGFIYGNLSYKEAEEILRIIENYCINNHFHKIFFIPTPSIYSKKINDTLEYLLHWNQYDVHEYYISSVINVGNSLSSIEYFNKRKRRYIQNYLKKNNIKVIYKNNFKDYYPILYNNKQKHGIKPTHTLSELINLDKIFPDKIHLLLLYHDKELIGGSLNIIANNKCGLVFYNMINYDYIEMQPASIQIYESINWAKKNRLIYLDLGVSQQPKSTNPLSPHTSLIYFKEQLGGIAIIRKAFQKTL